MSASTPTMRWSEAFIPTLREDPKDTEAISHKLMVRAGLIRRLGSGSYSYLPLGVRSLQRVIGIVREEMNRAGAQECLLPVLQPLDLWKRTGRDLVLKDILFRVKDRTGKDVVLGPTHEEVITALMAEVKSHRELPLILYQIQTKFRDEPRPRFGVIRSKEFLMKDAYSFDIDLKGLNTSYQRMYEAYQRIFTRCGLSVLACEAESGMMGGDVSHEFMAPAESGEDTVVVCSGCGHAANLEAAACPAPPQGTTTSETPKALKEIRTPGRHTVEQVSTQLRVSPAQLIKTLLYEVDSTTVAVLVRGDHEVNESKLTRLLKATTLKLASPATIERLTGAPMGFTGPVGLTGVTLVADHAVMTMVNAVTGANKAEMHLTHVNPGRDFTVTTTGDLRLVTPDDACVKCQKPRRFVRAIEVGHVFKLGTKYSQVLGAAVQDQGGKQVPMIMGCYGIGINRIMAAAIEQHHDEAGLVWPPAISPFDVVVTVLDARSTEVSQIAQESYTQLGGAGLAVLLDDRAQSAGSKLKDADLIGVPIQVVIGKVWEQSRHVEVVERASKTKHQVKPGELAKTIKTLLDKRQTPQ